MNIFKRDIGNSLWVTVSLLFAYIALISWFQISEVKQVHNKFENLSTKKTVKTESELRKKLKIAKEMPSLGFRNLVADGVFLNFLQYFSDVSERKDTTQSLSPDFFETIIALDPFYRDYYLFLSSSVTLYAAQPQKAVKIMEEGLEAITPNILSDSFYIWRYKAVDELLFLGNSQLAQRSFEQAAEWASHSIAPDSKAMGIASRKTAEFLAADPDSHAAQIAAWSSILSNALNDDIRRKAVQRINELGGIVRFREDGSIEIDSAELNNSNEVEKK